MHQDVFKTEKKPITALDGIFDDTGAFGTGLRLC